MEINNNYINYKNICSLKYILLGLQFSIKSAYNIKDNNTFKIGEMSMSNKIVRKFMSKIDELIDFIIKDSGRNVLWKEALTVYNEVIEIARKKEDFTVDDINLFQQKADLFFIKWVELHKADGVTNYIHMLGSGHFKYYLEKHKNLYIFSQQGWESLNSLIKLM